MLLDITQECKVCPALKTQWLTYENNVYICRWVHLYWEQELKLGSSSIIIIFLTNIIIHVLMVLLVLKKNNWRWGYVGLPSYIYTYTKLIQHYYLYRLFLDYWYNWILLLKLMHTRIGRKYIYWWVDLQNIFRKNIKQSLHRSPN